MQYLSTHLIIPLAHTANIADLILDPSIITFYLNSYLNISF